MITTTKQVSNLNDFGWVFLLNAVGEETGNGVIPERVNEWYQNTIADTEWLSYLVKNGDVYGLLYLVEIAHNQDDNFKEDKDYMSKEWIEATPEEVWNHIEKVSAKINDLVDCEVYTGKESGIFARHEICMFFPIGTNKEAIEEQFEKINDIDIMF